MSENKSPEPGAGALGNVFDGFESDPDLPRGRDLVCTVEVTRLSLGNPDGVRARVPMRLACEGDLATRARSPHEQEDWVTLHIGEDFPDGGGLRLLGQGEEAPEGGQAGDLVLRVNLTGPAPARSLATSSSSERGLRRSESSSTPLVLGILAASITTALLYLLLG